MKIYFAGSIRGGRDDKELYFAIIKLLREYGTVLTEHVGNAGLSSAGETTLSEEKIYSRDMKWIEEADVVVAEVTTPSLGVGYEIGKAEDMRKPTLCLFRSDDPGKRLSAMISGNKNSNVIKYQNEEEIKEALENFFTKLSK